MSAGRPTFTIPILAVAAFAATLGWYAYRTYGERGVTAEPPPAASTPVAPSESGAGPSASTQPSGQPAAGAGPTALAGTPSFDVVRVEPDGEAVVAGRGSPGASVELLVDGRRHAGVLADGSGLFAFTPEPLRPGSHELLLQATAGEGAPLRSLQSVTVSVAENRRDAPLITVTEPGRPAVVLSRPAEPSVVASASPRPAAPSPAGPVPAGPAPGGPVPGASPAASRGPDVAPAGVPARIDSVEVEGVGHLLVAGRVSPDGVARLYLNDTFVASATADGEGRVSFVVEKGVQPGVYRVRLDEVDARSAQVRTRAEVLFEMPREVAGGPPGPSPKLASADPLPLGGPPAPERPGAVLAPSRRSASADRGNAGATVVVPQISTASVVRGDSLWAISHRTYGNGWRFSVIYGANAKQIRDPNLIYPGQVLVLPTPSGDAAR